MNLGAFGRLGDLEVIIRCVPVEMVPTRPHPRKKIRIQKKMLSRYGYTAVVQKVDENEILVDRVRGRIYCYPKVADYLRREIRERTIMPFPGGSLF